MSIHKLITLNILFSPGKPNNTHSSRWSKLEVSNSLILCLKTTAMRDHLSYKTPLA